MAISTSALLSVTGDPVEELATSVVDSTLHDAIVMVQFLLESGKTWHNLLNKFKKTSIRLDETYIKMGDDTFHSVDNSNSADEAIVTSTPQKENEATTDQESQDNDVDVEIMSEKIDLTKIVYEPDVLADVSSDNFINSSADPDLLSPPTSLRQTSQRLNTFINKTYIVMNTKLDYKDYSAEKYRNDIVGPIIGDILNLGVKTSEDKVEIEKDDNINNSKHNVNTTSVKTIGGIEKIETVNLIDLEQEYTTEYVDSDADEEKERGVKLIGSSSEIEEDKFTNDYISLEKPYLTLNRDDDESSSDDESAGAEGSMHEIKLNASVEELATDEKKLQRKMEIPIQKSETLPRRIISRTARIYTWFRGVLRRSTLIGKPKKKLDEDTTGTPREERATKYVFPVAGETPPGSRQAEDASDIECSRVNEV